MILHLIRFLVWLAAVFVVATIEHSTGLPVVAITLIILAIIDAQTAWFIAFITLASTVIASLFLENLFVVWLILITTALLFRSPLLKKRKAFFARLAILMMAALVLALIRIPSITISFLLHSILSVVISAYLIWRQVGSKSRGLDIGELRFVSET